MLEKCFRLLIRDPGLLARKISNRIRPCLVRIPDRPVRKRINGVWFNFDFGLDGSLKRMYLRVYEVPLIEALRRHLRKGDTFIDVGASIGYISAVAAGLVGEGGEVHSFEPVLQFYERLLEMARMNPRFRIIANPCAAGEREETAQISITSNRNLGWNTMVPGFMDPETVREILPVSVIRLDDYISRHSLRRVSLIKIDTEGFEFPVLKGLSKFLAEAHPLPVLIVEVAPSAYPRMDIRLEDLREFMLGFGLHACDLDEEQEVDLRTLTQTCNVMFKPEK